MADSSFITGDGRSLNIDEIAGIFRETVNVAEPKSGKIQRLSDQRFAITCNFSTIDCDSQKIYNTSKVYSLTTVTRSKLRCIDSVMCVTDPQPVADSRTITSNNGRYVAHLRAETVSGEKKQMLAIWDRSKLLKVINVEEETDHGTINTDSTFGAMSWCPYGEQDKLIYVCQSKRPKMKSFFKQKVGDEKSETTEGSANSKQLNLGGQNLHVNDWGECLEGIEHTMIAVLDVGNGLKITMVDVNGYSLGDVKWLCDLKTVAVAYKEEPRRLGIIYCNNRPSSLIVHDWSQSVPTETMTLKSETNSYHTPRVDHSGRNFLYLCNTTFGPHYQAVSMHLFNLDTNQDRELVDKSNGKDKFITSLVNDCFTMDDQHILYVDLDVTDHQICLFDLTKSKISRIKFPMTGLSLLDFKYDVILATGSEINATPTLFVATLSSVNPGGLVAWHQIEDSIHLDEIGYKPAKIPTSDGSSFISTLLISPCLEALRKNFGTPSRNDDRLIEHQTELPTMVAVHGGPHSAFTTQYNTSFAFYCRLGLRVLMINYRGSSGVSNSYLKSLCGRVGELDVNDCLHAIRHYVNSRQVNPRKLIIAGGSHGGFLACHLSCNQEFKFTSAIIRNPVVDLASSHSTTDIPDWVSNEALGQDSFDFAWMPSPEELAEMYKRSPMSRSSEAHVPTLMVLGSLDKRVKMYQGERWYQLLKAKGVKTECKIYADRHALSETETYIDCQISIVLWVLNNL